MRKRGAPAVIRITGARACLTEDVRGRQRRYIISMSIRTLSVILTVVLWNVERPLAWATLVIGALLPYVAVVYANMRPGERPGAALLAHSDPGAPGPGGHTSGVRGGTCRAAGRGASRGGLSR